MSFSEVLLQWFDREARPLPWRAAPNDPTLRRDPYAVVVSEMMLQQTQVATVIEYFNRFMARFPTIEALAAADETDVLKLWEGLGYYRRARQLHALAREVTARFDGVLPRDRKALLGLSGVGPYTAGAIRAFAYDLRDAAVDGNVVRIASRVEAQPYISGDARSIRAVRERVLEILPPQRVGDFNEALMDLGATLCTPKNPLCETCPVASFCKARAENRVEDFPLKKKNIEKPVSSLTYVALRRDGRVFVRRRPPGLLEGLYEFLALDRRYEKEETKALRQALEAALRGHETSPAGGEEVPGLNIRLCWRGVKRAVFTHRIWEMTFWDAVIEGDAPRADGGGRWVTRDELAALPFSAFLVPWRDALLAGL